MFFSSPFFFLWISNFSFVLYFLITIDWVYSSIFSSLISSIFGVDWRLPAARRQLLVLESSIFLMNSLTSSVSTRFFLARSGVCVSGQNLAIEISLTSRLASALKLREQLSLRWQCNLWLFLARSEQYLA